MLLSVATFWESSPEGAIGVGCIVGSVRRLGVAEGDRIGTAFRVVGA